MHGIAVKVEFRTQHVWYHLLFDSARVRRFKLPQLLKKAVACIFTSCLYFVWYGLFDCMAYNAATTTLNASERAVMSSKITQFK